MLRNGSTCFYKLTDSDRLLKVDFKNNDVSVKSFRIGKISTPILITNQNADLHIPEQSERETF